MMFLVAQVTTHTQEIINIEISIMGQYSRFKNHTIQRENRIVQRQIGFGY